MRARAVVRSSEVAGGARAATRCQVAGALTRTAQRAQTQRTVEARKARVAATHARSGVTYAIAVAGVWAEALCARNAEKARVAPTQPCRCVALAVGVAVRGTRAHEAAGPGKARRTIASARCRIAGAPIVANLCARHHRAVSARVAGHANTAAAHAITQTVSRRRAIVCAKHGAGHTDGKGGARGAERVALHTLRLRASRDARRAVLHKQIDRSCCGADWRVATSL